ncbi:unnamed protein product [Ambrosiozyma monospora]|uniref:Carbonic anhydrase n=1 Tax=Ambrosiozyma monospora TaxID=43982 RepID=A0A9W7DJ14_AMBMO|nr:unnamed protein product [Ambrosiozyma monospora]
MAAVSVSTATQSQTTSSDVLTHECQHSHSSHSHSHNNDSNPSSSSSSSTYPFKFDKNSTLQDFLKSNKIQMDHLSKTNPEVMQISAHGQSPHTLWIGCSDSRVNECTALGCLPGEVFTLRNIANIITYQDLSATSSLQFAIDVLKVKKIIVCGHTDCGGIWGSLSSKRLGGVLDSWLTPIRQVRLQNLEELNKIMDPHAKCKRLSELNVLNSIDQIIKHPSFMDAFEEGRLEIYGLVYDVSTGYLHELELPTIEQGPDKLDDLYHVFQLSENGSEDDYSPH